MKRTVAPALGLTDRTDPLLDGSQTTAATKAAMERSSTRSIEQRSCDRYR